MSVLKLTDEQREAIWQGQYWGQGGVLGEVRHAYEQSDQCIVSMVTMMSAEYSALGRAKVNLRRGTLSERFEAPLRMYDSFIRARRLALAAAPQININTSTDSTEVVTTVLVKLGCKKVARKVLDNLPWHDLAFRSYVEPHTKAFLIRNAINCGLTDISARNLDLIAALATQTEARNNYRQAVRVWRTLLALRQQVTTGSLGHYKWVENRIVQALERADSADQRAKAG